MKKLLLLSAAFCVFSASSAMASEDEKALKNCPFKKGGKGYIEHMFESADADGDGSISAEEFKARHEAKFKNMDANGDGVVTKEEAKAAMKAKMEKMKASHGDKEHGSEDKAESHGEDGHH